MNADLDDPATRLVRAVAAGPPRSPLDMERVHRRARRRQLRRTVVTATAAVMVATSLPIAIQQLRGPAIPVVEQPTRDTLLPIPSPSGADLVTVRNVIGNPATQAVDLLERDGFEVVIEPADADLDALVIDQRPTRGEPQPRGTTVTIVVGTDNPGR